MWSFSIYTSINLILWLWIVDFRSDTDAWVTSARSDIVYEIQVKVKTLKYRHLNSHQRQKTQDPKIKRLTQLILKCSSTDWSLLALLTPLTAPALTSTNDNGELNFLATTASHCVLSSDSLTAMTTLILWQEATYHHTSSLQTHHNFVPTVFPQKA